MIRFLADVLVGKSSPAGRKQNLNVRLASEAQSWQVRGPRVSVATAPKDWMELEVLKIDGKRVRSARIDHADGEVIRLERAARDSNTFKVLDLPPGRVEKYEGVGNAVATALSYFNLEDVRPATEVDLAADPRATTTIRCYDGLVVAIETGFVEPAAGEDPVTAGEKSTWARLSATFEEPTTAEPVEGEDATAPPEAEEAITAEDVAAIHERVNSWVFKIASFKADALARRMEELLAEPEPEAVEPEDDPAYDEAITPELPLDEDLSEAAEPADPEVPQDG